MSWPASRPGFSISTSKVPADAARVERKLMTLDRGLQAQQALGFDLFGNLVGHRRARRARTLRIFEREAIRIADGIDEAQRIADVRFGFAREADDEIGGEREIRPRGAQPIDRAQIFRASVAAIYRLENAIGAGLHRQMKLRCELRQIAMRGDQVVVDVARMTGAVAQPRNAGDFGDAMQQPRPDAADWPN